ncbi:hypothetical protein E6W36_04565 [Hankyongella ginsenosidimutans]|uniref:S26 family signal peptidase n=1 Tax=Hankyongella ginsenosidimutans TaxID=1763828 RepID=A0A4D7C7D7_9SPHN|nr:hypothetical protein E6W36_04565 [Hankyongella ginsenosidimutans]
MTHDPNPEAGGGARTRIEADSSAVDGGATASSAAERARRAREHCPFLTTKQAAFHLGLAGTRSRRCAGSGAARRAESMAPSGATISTISRPGRARTCGREAMARLLPSRLPAKPTALIGLGAAALATTIALPPTPWLVWNASASAPIGLYAVSGRQDIASGDMVLVRCPTAGAGSPPSGATFRSISRWSSASRPRPAIASVRAGGRSMSTATRWPNAAKPMAATVRCRGGMAA